MPPEKVNSVAVSNCPQLLEKLETLDVKPIITINNPIVDKKLNYHTDLFLLNTGNNLIIIDESQKENIVNFLTIGYTVRIISQRVSSPYPSDSILNCVFLNDKLICNKAVVCEEVLNIAENLNYKIIDVKQGYSKCSICVLNDNAIITDDESIYKSTQLNQIDSLLISKGSVQLKGFDYGFIGGCTGLIDKNKLLFNGDINYHKDCNKILDFLSKHSIKPEIIENKPLTDIGSIIPLS